MVRSSYRAGEFFLKNVLKQRQVGQCKLTQAWKQQVSIFDCEKDNGAFNLNLVFLSSRHYGKAEAVPA